MDDIGDIESFIAGIEQTAPQEIDDSKHIRCQVCDTILEEVDEIWVCPNCGAQATDILQFDETELHYDESGRPIMGQRGARIDGKKRKNKSDDVDYGWAWSTDDAISHILSLQVTALENAGLLPNFFREAVTNMWFRFWLKFIAPHIKDEYNVEDLIPIEAEQALKLRDIEVLVKVQDKVMIPLRLVRNQQDKLTRQRKSRSYTMMGIKYHSVDQTMPVTSSSSSSDDDDDDTLHDDSPMHADHDNQENTAMDSQELDDLTNNNNQCEDNTNDINHRNTPINGINQIAHKNLTRNVSKDSITILTLNRTLAFIEATARCIAYDDPLFASDIIRACNQRLIPFYGAHKTLPDGTKLNSRDRLMFQKIRPPSPVQLTSAASFLIFKIYNDELPKHFPVPNLDVILKRFIEDLNLPTQLYNQIEGKFSFMDFTATKPLIVTKRVKKTFPQYDRWAFCILIYHLKDLYHLSNRYVNRQKKKALKKGEKHRSNYFVFAHWLQQMSVRLRIILTYDPFVLFHPLSSVNQLETTPQMLKYIETLMSDRATTDTRAKLNEYNQEFDEAFRLELTEFLCREIPKPKAIHDRLNEFLTVEEELEKSADIKHPITNSLQRTKKYWINELSTLEEDSDLILRDFSTFKMITLSDLPQWTFDNDWNKNPNGTKRKAEIDPNWPSAFKLLLLVGSFLCFCEPIDMYETLLRVERRIHPCKRASARNRPEDVDNISDQEEEEEA